MKHVTSVTSALVAAVAVAGFSTVMAGPATKPTFRSASERLQAGRARRRSAAIGCIILIGLAAIVIAALGR